MKRNSAIWWVFLAVTVAAGCTGKMETEESALSFIFADRPRLAETLVDHGEVKTWIESRFEPGAMPVDLMWDPGEPQGGQAAEHEYLSEDGPAVIRIGSGFSGLDQLTGLIYELINIEDYPAFQVIYDSALRGDIDRREYSTRMLAQEFEGLQRTRAYIGQHLADHTEDPMHENPMYFRVMQADTSLAAHIEKYAKNGFDLHTYFEQLYDQEILPKREQE